MREDFDFGFSLEDDNFVPPKAQSKIDSQINELQQIKDRLSEEKIKLFSVMKAIMPLLNNLASNPEKPTIYWPSRVEKITEFKQKLLDLAQMDEEVEK